MKQCDQPGILNIRTLFIYNPAYFGLLPIMKWLMRQNMLDC